MHRRYPRPCTRTAAVRSLAKNIRWCRRPPAGGETEDPMVFGPLVLGIGIGLLAGQLLVWVIIGLGAGITLHSVMSERRKGSRRGVS